jgi:DNA-binding GntR family transcriptional regulator
VNLREVVRTDTEFHRALVAAAGNSRLARAHGELPSEIALCITQIGGL